ncbi:MAG: insulinase family protein [Legionella sp.]|nr:insulinase family protein [Legionella sp.]
MRFIFMLICAVVTTQVFGQVQAFTLENGFNIRVKEDHRAPVAVSMIWYRVGSSDEPFGITGVSHALEHMMFKGTPLHPRGVFSKTIAALGGQENAFTHYDYTAYFEKIASNQLATVFELEADRMEHLLLDETEFKHEMKVIKEERRLRTDDNPHALTLERYMAAAHLSAPYQHPVIGWMSDIDQMQVNTVRDWYHRFYTPSNATLVVVGDVKAQDVYELAKKYFGGIKGRELISRKYIQEPPILGKKSVEVTAPAQLPLVFFGYSVPSAAQATTTWEPYALEILAAALAGGDSARLSQNLMSKNHIASSFDVHYNLYSQYTTEFMLLGMPSPTHTVKELKAAMLKEIDRLKKQPLTKEELHRVKTQLIAQKTFEKDSLFGQAMEIGLVETVGLGYNVAEKYLDAIQRITPHQLQEVAQRYFQVNRETEALLIPKRSLANTQGVA